MKRAHLITFVLAPLLCTAPIAAVAGQVVLIPAKDNTIFSNDASSSNGAGPSMFAGATNQGFVSIFLRRALVAFDVSGNVPAGAIITSATLRLVMTRTQDLSENVTLHRLQSDWGEGSSISGTVVRGGGRGVPATSGDATWVNTFHPGSTWTSPGGDFAPVASAALEVGLTGVYVWGPTPQMTDDVQSWLDDDSANFGWLLKGGEDVRKTAKRFAPKENENEALWPRLTIEFDVTTPTQTTTWGAVKNLYR